jgi:hypothetical protein
MKPTHLKLAVGVLAGVSVLAVPRLLPEANAHGSGDPSPGDHTAGVNHHLQKTREAVQRAQQADAKVWAAVPKAKEGGEGAAQAAEQAKAAYGEVFGHVQHAAFEAGYCLGHATGGRNAVNNVANQCRGEVDKALGILRASRDGALVAVRLAEQAAIKAGTDPAAQARKAAEESAKNEAGQMVAALDDAFEKKFGAELDAALAAAKELSAAVKGLDEMDEALKKKAQGSLGKFDKLLTRAKASVAKVKGLAGDALDVEDAGNVARMAVLFKKAGISAASTDALLKGESTADVKIDAELDATAPALAKHFADTKAALAKAAAEGERILKASVPVLKPSVQQTVNEKILKSYLDDMKASKAALEDVVDAAAKMKEQQQGGGGGGAEGGGSEGATEKKEE